MRNTFSKKINTQEYMCTDGEGINCGQMPDENHVLIISDKARSMVTNVLLAAEEATVQNIYM